MVIKFLDKCKNLSDGLNNTIAAGIWVNSLQFYKHACVSQLCTLNVVEMAYKDQCVQFVLFHVIQYFFAHRVIDTVSKGVEDRVDLGKVVYTIDLVEFLHGEKT